MLRQLAWQNWLALFHDWRVFAEGLGQTVVASVLSLALALAIGVVTGVAAASPARAPRALTRVYVEFFQNTPLVVQVFFLYYGLGNMRVNLPVLWVGVIGLSVYTGAYICEIVRAGIGAIHRGQMEAAYAQGFTYAQAMWYVILPQSARVILPPLTNQFVNLIKNSSVLSMIAGGDLMYRADSWSSVNFKYGVAFVAMAALYLALTLPVATLARRLERRLAIPGHQVAGA